MSEVRTYEIDTSITLDYRRLNWGLERIVLDSIQNHLPADSKGTKTSVRLKQGGMYVDLKEADPEKHTEEIVFEDNGSGYAAGLLGVMFSTKGVDQLAVGEKGEGLKLVAAAALRGEHDIEYRSRNWIAKPISKEVEIDQHRMKKLGFQVTENGDRLEGSRTVFRKPKKELVDEVFRLPKKVLVCNPDYKVLHDEKDNVDYSPFKNKKFTYVINKDPLASMREDPEVQEGLRNLSERYIMPKSYTDRLPASFRMTGPYKSWGYNSKIIDVGEGKLETKLEGLSNISMRSLFVKGVKVQNISALFDYDLGIENISPDRAHGDEEVALDIVRELLEGCVNQEVIRTVLKKAYEAPESGCYELEAFRPQKSRRFGRSEEINEEINEEIKYKSIFKKSADPNHLWVKTFKEMFGEEAVIASIDTNLNNDATLMGYTVVKLNRGIEKYLAGNGIRRVVDLPHEREYRWVPLEELTDAEIETLARVEDINYKILKRRPEVDVRVYEGMFTKTGREIPTSEGVTITHKDGTKRVGIKRSILKDPTKFNKTYIHELGHVWTGKEDADRGFADFFISALADTYSR